MPGDYRNVKLPVVRMQPLIETGNNDMPNLFYIHQRCCV